MEKIALKIKPTNALAENSFLRYFTFIVLYFSQGIPEGLTLFGIPAWMAMNGKSTEEISGYSAIVLIPFAFKILFAPVMERYSYLPMGKRRPWLLFGQFGILCGLIALSFVPDPLNNVSLLITSVLCLHVFIIFQDIATDSLVIDIVPLEQQGKANSLMWGAKTVGTSVSLFIGSWLINNYGFSTAALLMSTSVCCIMFVPLLLRERNGEKLLPFTKGETSPEAKFLKVDSWFLLFKSFKQVILLRNILLLTLIVFFITGTLHYMRTLFPIFTVKELGWSNIDYSKVFSTASLLGGIVGMLIGGFLIGRLGIIKLLQTCLFIAGLFAIIMAFSVSLWKINAYTSAFIGIFCVLITLINICVLALAMQVCWKRISALQFTFFMTIFNTGLSAGSALLGFLSARFDWQIVLLIYAGIVFSTALLLKLIKIEIHLNQVEILESKYLENKAN